MSNSATPTDIARRICPNWMSPEGDAHYRDVRQALAGFATENADLRRQLEEAKRKLTMASVCEIGAENPSVVAYMHHWESRAEKAEAQLTSTQADKDMLTGQLQECRTMCQQRGIQNNHLKTWKDQVEADKKELVEALAQMREKYMDALPGD